jgi:NitT/TauT family transport system substrate-binding protein
MNRLSRGMRTIIPVFLLATLAGCGASASAETSESSNGLKTIRVSEIVHSILYTPMYAADALGYFADEGLKVNITTANGGDAVSASLIGGQAEIGLVGPEMAVYVHNNPEGDAKLVTFSQLTNTDGLFLNSFDARDNFKWEDVIGKTIIGSTPGSTPQLVLEYVLDQNGIDIENDVKVITNLDPPARAGAFSQGIAEFGVMSSPSSEDFDMAGHPIVASMGEEVGALPYTVFLSENSWLKDNEGSAQAFSDAVYRAMLWTKNATAAEIAETIKPYFAETDTGTVTAAIERYKNMSVPIWAPTPVPNEKDMETFLDIQVFGGLVAEDARPAFDDIFVTHIAENSVKNVKSP